MLTIVMYHYVRPIRESRYPAIKGLEMADFEGQLDYLQAHYELVTASQVIAARRAAELLPDNAALLTFDDGYIDHWHASQRLQSRGISGVFFPPAGVVQERKVLDVNKVHFILACTDDIAGLVSHIEHGVEAARDRFDLETLSSYRDQFWQANRFDPAEVIYIKRMLQTGLPEALRATLVDQLFKQFVSADETAFADELYVNEAKLREMRDMGMEIGSHGYRHYWLNHLSADAQAADIDRSLTLLDNLGIDREDFLFCYPYGGYNDDTVRLLSERHCGAAFTTEVNLASDAMNLLTLPRLDTNDLPQSAQAATNQWTDQVRHEV